MNGKELLEMLNKMSEKELLDTHYDLIGFDLNDVDYCYEEIQENWSYGGTNYDDEFAKLSDDDKRNLIKQAMESEEIDPYRADYVWQIGDRLRDVIYEKVRKKGDK